MEALPDQVVHTIIHILASQDYNSIASIRCSCKFLCEAVQQSLQSIKLSSRDDIQGCKNLLSKIPCIRSITLRGEWDAAAFAEMLQQWPHSSQLQSMDSYHATVTWTPSALQTLCLCAPNLHRVAMSLGGSSTAGLFAILPSSLVHLELDCSDTNMTDAELQGISRLARLRELKLLPPTSTSDGGLSHVCRLPALTTLRLFIIHDFLDEEGSIAGAFIPELVAAAKLQRLSLQMGLRTHIWPSGATEENLRQLSALITLVELSLHRINDTVIHAVSHLPALEFLNITGSWRPGWLPAAEASGSSTAWYPSAAAAGTASTATAGSTTPLLAPGNVPSASNTASQQARFPRLSELRALAIMKSCHVDKLLPLMANLKILALSGHISGATMLAVSRLTQLQDLHLSGALHGEEGAVCSAWLRAGLGSTLRRLSLGSALLPPVDPAAEPMFQLTDQTVLTILSGMSKLRKLQLSTQQLQTSTLMALVAQGNLSCVRLKLQEWPGGAGGEGNSVQQTLLACAQARGLHLQLL